MDITLSQKEKTLLQDQKSSEQICIEKYTKYANQTNNSQLKQIFDSNAEQERTHLDTINQLLNGKLPQMNQQQNSTQNQSQGQNMGQGQGQGQNMNFVTNMSNMGNMGINQNSNSDLSEKDMCADLLMTEKFVSGAYDTTIFEFRDSRVRDALNHIQKEEQQHGQAISQYMINNGMYTVQ